MDDTLIEKLESAKELAVADCSYELAANIRDLIAWHKQQKEKTPEPKVVAKPELPPLKIINTQPSENPVKHVRGWIEIVNQPWITIQGEGPFHGYPAVFIRLAGCNLSGQCIGCDTDYTSNRKFYPPTKIVEQVQEIRLPKCLVVITGGEPFRQNITLLTKLLLNTGYTVQIETNGTYYSEDFPWNRTTIVCSPKTPKLHPQIETCINCYKYVLDSENIDEQDGLPTSVLGSGIRPFRPFPVISGGKPIYVSPCDEQETEKNEKNLRATIQSVLKYGYILSVQSQKIIGLP